MPPLSVLIKPASGHCNMRCKYCFYTDETKNREVASMGHMSLDTMHTIVDKAMLYADETCVFGFQGGEPSTRGLEFFRDFTAYVSNHPNPKGLRVEYAFQTNGYAIDEEWVKWFADNRVLVGVSLDGPKEIHDRYRVDHYGKGTYHRVMGCIRLLEKYGVEYNVLTVVSGANARRAQQLYAFFKKNGIAYQQYIECLDPIGEVPGTCEYSLTPRKYAAFLKQLFDVWYRDIKSGKYVYNRYFENLLMIMSGQVAESCAMRGMCNKQWVIEADGSVYPCDFYALDQWKLGNIVSDSFEEMDQRRSELGFIQWSQRISEACKGCKWYALCKGGCRRNREPVTNMSTNVNCFCDAYQQFFEYAYPRLQEIHHLRYRRIYR